MEETAWERVQQAWSAVGKKLSDWGVVSPRLMLAGGGLFLTLSNWGLLPSVCISSWHRNHLPVSSVTYSSFVQSRISTRSLMSEKILQMHAVHIKCLRIFLQYETLWFAMLCCSHS